MKKTKTMRFLSGFLALVMILLVLPIVPLNVVAEDQMTTVKTTVNSNEKALEKYRIQFAEGFTNDSSQDDYQDKLEEILTDYDTRDELLQLLDKGKTANAYRTALQVGCNALSCVPGMSFVKAGAQFFQFGKINGANDTTHQMLLTVYEGLSTELRLVEERITAQMTELANAQKINTEQLAEYLANKSDWDSSATKIAEFQSQTSGNDRFGKYKSYPKWKQELYTAFSDLVDRLETNVNLKEGYDNLYAVAKEADDLYSYMTYDNFGAPIQDILFEYYILNAQINQNSEEFEENISSCIEQVTDWYNTYLFSQMCLELCYSQQFDHLVSLYGTDLVKGQHYYYQDNASVPYAEICDYLADPVKDINVITAKVAQYFARVLYLDESYIYETGNWPDNDTTPELFKVRYQEFKNITEASYNKEAYNISQSNINNVCYTRYNNEVSAGDTIYMNTMPDSFSDIFDFTQFNFVTNHDKVSVTSNGIVRVDENLSEDDENTFTVSMLYGDDIVYSMDFKVVERKFAGGMGSESAPFLISDFSHLENIATNEEFYATKDIYFRVIQDIDGEGKLFAGIPSFSGCFDGNGFHVYNFHIDTSGTQYCAFFRVLESSAIVKRLTLGYYDKQYASYDNYSVSIKGYLNNDGVFYVGGLCGNNNGIIEACAMENASVTGEIYWSGDNNISNIVGGIAGLNNNIVKGCYVFESLVHSRATTLKDTDASECRAYSGGVVGKNKGTVVDSLSYNNIIGGYTYSHQEWGGSPGAWTYCGGLLGFLDDKSTINECYEKQNDLYPVVSADGSADNSGAYSDGIYGYRATTFLLEKPFVIYLGTINNCQKDSIGFWTIDSSTGCPRKFTIEIEPSINANSTSYIDITTYIRGEIHFLKNKYIAGNYQETITCDLQHHRIDTSMVGPSRVVVLQPVAGSSIYTKSVIDITVVEKEVESLLVYTPPVKRTYAQDETHLDLYGLTLVALYNNGTSKILDNGEKAEYSSELDMTTHGEEVIKLRYGGQEASVSIEINSQDSDDNDEITPHEHTYTDWTSVDYEQHVRTCTSCGETEYQKHETQNVIESGTEYIICLHCDYKDKVETIDPPIVSKHEYGEWLGIDDKLHYRTCELCGEQEIAEHNFDVTSEGKVCSDCGYVIVPEEPPVPSAVITAENKTSPAGKTVQVKLDLSNNPGFAYLRLTVKYDTDALTLVKAENGSIIKDFDQGVNLMWSADKNATANGTMVTLIFEIDEEAEAGDYPVDIVIRECYDENYNDVPVETVDGVITVIDFIYGDVNGDFKVDGKDVLMLRKYLSNYDDDTGMSTVEVSFGSDANGDGITNGKDLLLLRKYMANYDDDLGSSTVVLGPAA